MSLSDRIVRSVCETLASILPTRMIPRGDDEEYLARHYIFKREWVTKHLGDSAKWLPSVYLHQFLASDDEPEYHNHPFWKSMSIILAGSYEDERLEPRMDWKRPKDAYGTRRRMARPGMVNFIDKDDFHKVTLQTKTVWTLFFTLARVQNWGFYDIDKGEFVWWEEHIRRRYAERNGAVAVTSKPGDA